MAKRQSSGEALAQAARRYIEEHSGEKFSLGEMAGELFVNKSYLLRAFRRSMGVTPLAYHHAVRCERAKELLLHTDRSISGIGEAVGFVSSSHFPHVFRRTEGCTPSEYRQSHAAETAEKSEAARRPDGME